MSDKDSVQVDEIRILGRIYREVTVSFGQYVDDESTAITLWDDKGAIATATVFVKGVPPDKGCVWIKNYAENAGILEALTKAKVLVPTGRVTQVGVSTVREARLLRDEAEALHAHLHTFIIGSRYTNRSYKGEFTYIGHLSAVKHGNVEGFYFVHHFEGEDTLAHWGTEPVNPDGWTVVS